MGVEIIDSLQLGTNKPLDNRYNVNSIYDVSMYWYNGMQMYEPSSNLLYIVRDVSLELIEVMIYQFDTVDGGENWQTPTNDQLDGGSW